MKRYFMIAMACVLVLAVGVVVYGAWLNKEGENVIADRMNNRALSLQGVPVQRRHISPVLRWQSVHLSADEMVDAVARVDGIVQAVMIDRQSYVQQGQVIVQLQNEELPLKIKQTDSAIAAKEADKKRTYNAYQRHQMLLDQNATSLQQLDEAEANYKAVLASIDELHAQREQLFVQLNRQNIEAPISGDVLMLYRRPGTFVTAGTSVALIGGFDKLQFKVSMPDRQIRSMMPLDENKQLYFPQKDFDKVYYTDYGAGNAGDDQQFQAHIASVTPELDVPAEMRYVVWEIDNGSGMLEPKTYSNMYIKTMQDMDVLAAPLSAMVDQNNNAVYVLGSDGNLEHRSIRTGADDGRYIEILDGLQAGDLVIISGTDGLETGTRADVEIREDE